MENVIAIAKIIEKFYYLVCYALWGYLVYLLTKQYIDNKDSTQLSYKKFQSSDDGYVVYPTFSVCTPSKAIYYPLVHTELYNELYDHPICQKPNVTHQWCEIGLYQKMLLGKEEITPNSSTQDVDNITKSLLPKMEKWHFMESKDGWYHEPRKRMYLSYQDALRVCYTKKIEPVTGRNHTYDLYTINAKKLNLPLEIYAHKVGGLIEQLGKKYILDITTTEIKELYKDFKTTKESSSTGKGLSIFHDFHIEKIETIRKRYDAKLPCNHSIQDNDEVYKETLIKSVGCIPSYWKRFTSVSVASLPDCNTKLQFEKLSNMLPSMYESTNLKNGTKLYVQPCTEMKIWTRINKRNVRSVGMVGVWLAFYYDADEYKEIVNNQAFTINDEWSQIGGYVGIFLGYSCLQVYMNILEPT